MLDRHGRDVHYLRLSVTDRCNLRCLYCMPQQGVKWVRHEEILSFEEMLHLVRLLAPMGIDRVRLTGGEPLVREGVPGLVSGLKAIDGIRWVGLTTNGVLLEEQLPALMAAGLDAVNISLDTLDPAQYAQITRRSALEAALRGLRAARSAASHLTVKVNCVPTAQNRDQWVPLAALVRDLPAIDVRFIELMPVGLGGSLPRREERNVLSELQGAFGPAQSCMQDRGGGPGRYVTFNGFSGRVGFISAMSHRFCDGCNRVRLTASGMLKPCLQQESPLDLRAMLRSGAGDKALSGAMERAIYCKPARHRFDEASAPGEERLGMNWIGG